MNKAATMQCISPIDNSLYAQRPYVQDDKIASIMQNSQAAQKQWALLSIKERSSYIQKFLEIFLANTKPMVEQLAWQMGRPVRYGGEFGPFKDRVEFALEAAQEALQPIVPSNVQTGIKRLIKRVPVGVVLVIAPWNYPYVTAVNGIIPALLAGNSVLLKHSNQTLLVGEHFQEAFDQAGLPKHLFQNLVLSHPQTEKMIKSGHINHITFTGSVRGGQIMEEVAAGTFATLTLELGGKDPAYVRADADLDFTVQNLAEGAFYNAGQCCCGIERIYVAQSIYQKFIDAFIHETNKLKLGNPLDQETSLGPLANQRFAKAIHEQIAEAKHKGAKSLIEPKHFAHHQEGAAYMAPQVLVNVDHSMKFMMEESFGPVVGIMPVSDDEQAIQYMNESPYGLTASIWTKDLSIAEKIGDAVDTGTVFMNRCDFLDPWLAWTGTKNTGKGQSLSVLGIQTYTRPKSYHLRFHHA